MTDRTAEALLAGRLPCEDPDTVRLASFVADLWSEYLKPVSVRTELAEIFAEGVNAGHRDPSTASDVTTHSRSRRRTVLATLSTFVATLTGKIVLASAAVAAGVGGAHAAGVVDVPGLPDRPAAVEDAPPNEVSDVSDAGGGRPDSPGVDGDEISDRATSGEPREDGRSFGSSVADEAVEGTPAEELRRNRGEAADDRRPDGVPVGGSDVAEDQRPDTLSGSTDVAEANRPDIPVTGGTGGQPDQPPAGGADPADDHRSSAPTTADQS